MTHCLNYMKKKISYNDISVENTRCGFLLLTAIVDGYLVSRRYMDYTRKEAKRLFYCEVNGITD